MYFSAVCKAVFIYFFTVLCYTIKGCKCSSLLRLPKYCNEVNQ